MHFHDDALFPENQEKLVITVAPYGPEWDIDDFPEDLPLTMDEHVQKAVDCYEAGATVLHIHVRELDGKGSKRLSKFNELLARLREAVPEMILQVGGSISFAPEGEGADAKWLSDDARHMLAELDPKPDQVTIAINTNQMNIVELMTADDIAGTSFERPEVYDAYREMTVPAGPGWVAEHLRRLQAAGIQPHFQLASIAAARDRRAADPPRRLHRPAHADLGRHRRRLRRPEPVQHDGVHPPHPRRRGAHPGNPDAQRAAGQHDGHRDGPARPLRQRGHPVGPQGREDDLRRSRSSSWSASPASSAARSPPARKPAKSTASTSTTPAPTRPSPSSATPRTAAPANSASPTTPDPTLPR